MFLLISRAHRYSSFISSSAALLMLASSSLWGAAQWDVTRTCLPFVTEVDSLWGRMNVWIRTKHSYWSPSALACCRLNQSDKPEKMTVCISCENVRVWERERERESEREQVGEIVNLLFSLGLNWCVVFPCKLSETMQVQTPAVPPGPCHPPRLVGKPKAREVQLRWGESFLSNSDLCGMNSSFCWWTSR